MESGNPVKGLLQYYRQSVKCQLQGPADHRKLMMAPIMVMLGLV